MTPDLQPVTLEMKAWMEFDQAGLWLPAEYDNNPLLFLLHIVMVLLTGTLREKVLFLFSTPTPPILTFYPHLNKYKINSKGEIAKDIQIILCCQETHLILMSLAMHELLNKQQKQILQHPSVRKKMFKS